MHAHAAWRHLARRPSAIALVLPLAIALGGLVAYGATTGDVSLVMNVNNTFTVGSLGTLKANVGKTYSTSYAAGTSTGQVNEGWTSSIALAASTPQTLDLTALTGEASRVVTFSKVKALAIKNTHASASLVVGNAAANPWTPGWSAATNTTTIGPGDVLHVTRSGAGFTVTNAGADNLKLDPGASAITVEILILGNS